MTKTLTVFECESPEAIAQRRSPEAFITNLEMAVG